MNGADDRPEAVTAKLPSGIPLKVELAGSGAVDGMTSVGLRDLNLSDALGAVAETAALLAEKLRAAKPDKVTAELKFGFAVESGTLVALWVNGKGEASCTVTLEWSGHAEPDSGKGDNG
jgi:hypothetical protein